VLPEARIASTHSAWPGVQAGACEQLRHSEDAVHRRADLVAHRGEEVALGAAGGLGALAREFGALLGLAFADVGERALVAAQPPAVIEHAAGRDGNLDLAAVASAPARLEADHPFFHVEAAEEAALVFGTDEALRTDVGDSVEEVCRAVVTEEADQRRVGGQEATVGIDLEDPLDRVLVQRAVGLLGLLKAEVELGILDRDRRLRGEDAQGLQALLVEDVAARGGARGRAGR
jgi:hypothetical protein